MVAAEGVRADILAMQEIHLASLPLEWACSTARNLQRTLHHGRPVPVVAGSTFGRSCGVGFLVKQSIAASPVLSSDSAWRYRGTRAASRPHCPLLTALLGPGAAWIDVHVALSPPPLDWTFCQVDSMQRLAASHIYLVLTNSAARYGMVVTAV